MAKLKSGNAEVVAEFEQVSLGDRRLNDRLRLMVESLAAEPSRSFPDAMSTAEREGAYRFFANDSVSFDDILGGHVTATLRRIRSASASTVRILHDTTPLKFRGDREGLGIIARDTFGFFGHFSLAVGSGADRPVLGILAMKPYIQEREKTEARRGLTPGEIAKLTQAIPRAEKQSSRWDEQAIHASSLLPAGTEAIHVMDQEADDYTMFERLLGKGLRFVVRGSGNRLTAGVGSPKIQKLLNGVPAKLFRAVKLNPRTKKTARGRNQVRDERPAELHIRWAQVSFKRPRFAEATRPNLPMWVVEVFEPNPPSENDRVNWVLFTSEPVTTLEEAAVVVDHYRARWLIEEYFKALKTGCAIEKRQLTSYEGLVRALAMFVPMAWYLLALRQMSRLKEPPAATTLFDSEQLLLLAAMVAERRRDLKITRRSSVGDALLAIAAIGGHIKQNGEPGWQVLGRGCEKFFGAEVGWRLARLGAEM